MHNALTKNKEIDLTKELAKRLRRKLSASKIYANKCPSRSPVIRRKWQQIFNQTCPPLQPEMDLIIWEPKNSTSFNNPERIRAVEIKCFSKENGRVNQSFYKGIEQSLALLQWGFDNVALWQFFDESFTNEDIRNYGCKTWLYVHGLLHLPIEFTPFKIIGREVKNVRFNVIHADWENNLQPITLLDIDDKGFNITWTHPNPFVNLGSFQSRKTSIAEIAFLRKTLFEWLNLQKTI